MNKILTTEQAIKISEALRSTGKKIVLAGGCFDILHLGHITFLEKAKTQADIFFVLLESDENIKRTKGQSRPINTQNDRAKILSSLTVVDYVVTLPDITDNKLYDDLVIRIKPAIIATTAGDSNRSHKERQAEKIQAKVIDVTPPISNQSTSRLVNIFNEL
jgi:rfaE bifunctional protein nucleotidyltransferase chain/domain